MKKFGFGMVYTACAAFAITAASLVVVPEAVAGEAMDTDQLTEMREGDMRKLNFHSAPKEVSSKSFAAEDGSEMKLADYQGKVVLLNFWATWCAPCRHEMPMLSELQSELGGEDFEVVTLATGRNLEPAMKKFFAEIGVDNLPLHRDPKQEVARDMAVLGLPATLILNREGQEIARLQGDADWSSENAHAIVSAVIRMTAP